MRRSNRLWAGLGSDLVIEQVLMQSLKSRGGLTRESGFAETQRATWLLSMPICSIYNLYVQEFAGVLIETSEQHKEVRDSMQKRDSSDLQKVVDILKPISLFQLNSNLRNIVTGVTAEDKVNVDEFQLIGNRIISTMIGANVFTYSARRSDKAITFGSADAVLAKLTPAPRLIQHDDSCH